MGRPSKQRYEMLAQGVAKGQTALEAYVAAGGSNDKSNAWRAVRRPEVKARIEELQAKSAERTLVTMQGLTDRLMALIDVAEKTGIEYDAEGKPTASSPKHLTVLRAAVMDVAK